MSLSRLAVVALAVAVPLTVSAAKVETYKVDPTASSLTWVGKKVTGQHNGHVPIKEGKITVTDGNVTGGEFVIDTANLVVDDLKDPGANQKLTGHLKSDDFFGVEKYPTSKFKINKVEPAKDAKNGATHTVSGDLTVKGKTHPVVFPARISIDKGMVKAQADDVAVDRTLYDIRYGSGKFFDNLGDKVIDDQFWLDVSIGAKK